MVRSGQASYGQHILRRTVLDGGSLASDIAEHTRTLAICMAYKNGLVEYDEEYFEDEFQSQRAFHKQAT
jgi:hypothetical protein